MTRHDPLVYVRHMLDHAREAADMVRGRSRADLDLNRQLNLALVRLMEDIGEAATRVPEEFQSHHPQAPWHLDKFLAIKENCHSTEKFQDRDTLTSALSD